MLSLKTMAQMNQAEAKAAYLLAEESFASSNWESTINYLEQCKSLLGTTNSKILYLKLLAQVEIAKSNPEHYNEVIKTITDFENAPDVKNYNEDKVIEVMKLKLQVKEWQAANQREQKSISEANEKYSNSIQTILKKEFLNLPLKVSYSGLLEKQKDHPFLKNKHNGKEENFYKGYITNYNYKNFIYYSFAGSLAVHVKADQVHGYRLISQAYNSDKETDAAINALVEQYSSEFGFKPHIWNQQYTDHFNKYLDVFEWKNGKTIFKIIARKAYNINNGKFMGARIFLDVFEGDL